MTKIESLYAQIEKRLTTAREARNNAKTEQQRLMLAGKVKAYTDILCLINDRYKERQP